MLILLTISRIPFGDLPQAVQGKVRFASRGMGANLAWKAAPDAGIIEYVLDEALAEIQARIPLSAQVPTYILRLDDDEWASPPLVRWLRDGGYVSEPHWKFPRMHRWGTGQSWLELPQLWPDHQTRLSRIDLAGGRNVIHAGSPHGGGTLCDHPIIHDKFLKPLAERLAIAARYDAIKPGAGTGLFLPYQAPEQVYDAEQWLAAATRDFPYGDPE